MLTRRLVPILIISLLILASLNGCSKFQSKKRLHLAPFAEDMIALAGGVQYELGRHQPVYLQGYIDVPEALEMEALSFKIRAVMRAIIGYSIQVVTLGESELSGPDRCLALADYLDGLLRPVLARPTPAMMITVADLDTIIADLKTRDGILGGLKASQPVVDEIARISGELFDQTAIAMEKTRYAIQVRVDEDYQDIRKADRELRRYQLQAVTDVTLFPLIRQGDRAAADTLAAHQPSLRQILAPGRVLDETTLHEAEERLLFLMQTLSELRRQLEPDLITYRETRKELGIMYNVHTAALRQGRVAIIAWARAHDRLASGITDPAEINVLGIARKAAGGFLPI